MYYIRVDMQYKVEKLHNTYSYIVLPLYDNLSRQRAMELIYDNGINIDNSIYCKSSLHNTFKVL